MIDVVREATVVPLPLQFAMIAQRAGAAIQLLEQSEDLSERHRRALDNAAKFLEQAVIGKNILSGVTPGVYNPDAMSAFEVTESVSKNVGGDFSADFRERFQQQLQHLLEQAKEQPSDLSRLRKFFHDLAEWCLGGLSGQPGFPKFPIPRP
jgi:hypothetical protein